MTVAKVATVRPIHSELRMDQVNTQKMSCPRLFVPIMCSELGGMLRK